MCAIKSNTHCNYCIKESSMEFIARRTFKKPINAKLVSSSVTDSIQKATLNFHQPKSLFLVATEFIVHHLLYVESFSTLPDIVGEEIFKVALQTKQFDKPGDCIKGLQLFTTAYKGKVLDSLTIKQRKPVLDEYYLELKLFLHIRELDVSSCDIDDNHSILVHIGTQLSQLERLLIKNNSLTDKGIQTLTACSRMMGYGLTNLTFLDLSGNTTISDKVAAYMKCFNQLSTLNLSNCNISVCGKERIARHLHLIPCEIPMSEPLDDDVVNKGWAAPLIDSWRSLTPDLYSHNRPSKSAEKFYSKKKIFPRKTETKAAVYKHLLFLRRDLPKAKLSWTAFAPVESGIKNNDGRKCHKEFSEPRFDTTETGIATGYKRQASPFPVEAQRKRAKHLLKFSSNKFFSESLLEFYHKEKLSKESSEHVLDSSQIERVAECKKRVNPFVTEVQRKEPMHPSADCMDKHSMVDTLEFYSMPSKEFKNRTTARGADFITQNSGKDLSVHKMSDNSMSPTLDEDSHSDSMVEPPLADSVAKDCQALGEVKNFNARHMTKHSQVRMHNNQIKRHQKTNMRRKRTKLKIVKENPPLQSELSEVSEDYSCKRAKQSNCLDDQQLVRRTLLDFLD